MGLYWAVGAHISEKIARAEWGDGVVEALAAAIARQHPGLRGFTRANLFRMRQFYDAYARDPKVAPMVRRLAWSHHLLILGRARSPPERRARVAGGDRAEGARGPALGKLAFYLEALDRDVRKPHERPSIGVLLCATKDAEVVEYALRARLE